MPCHCAEFPGSPDRRHHPPGMSRRLTGAESRAAARWAKSLTTGWSADVPASIRRTAGAREPGRPRLRAGHRTLDRQTDRDRRDIGDQRCGESAMAPTPRRRHGGKPAGNGGQRVLSAHHQQIVRLYRKAAGEEPLVDDAARRQRGRERLRRGADATSSSTFAAESGMVTGSVNPRPTTASPIQSSRMSRAPRTPVALDGSAGVRRRLRLLLRRLPHR